MLGANSAKFEFFVSVAEVFNDFMKKNDLRLSDIKAVTGTTEHIIANIKREKSCGLDSLFNLITPMGYTLKVVKVQPPSENFKKVRSKRKKAKTKKNAELRRKYRKKHGIEDRCEQNYLPTTF